mmetsp:Transcript_13347/g.35825  ORF Transcript_13347/g.35825 Transcript_13347/m.35825 type:complete len:246 (+) Transcript_13347:1056-1793(+)
MLRCPAGASNFLAVTASGSHRHRLFRAVGVALPVLGPCCGVGGARDCGPALDAVGDLRHVSRLRCGGDLALALGGRVAIGTASFPLRRLCMGRRSRRAHGEPGPPAAQPRRHGRVAEPPWEEVRSTAHGCHVVPLPRACCYLRRNVRGGLAGSTILVGLLDGERLVHEADATLGGGDRGAPRVSGLRLPPTGLGVALRSAPPAVLACRGCVRARRTVRLRRCVHHAIQAHGEDLYSRRGRFVDVS